MAISSTKRPWSASRRRSPSERVREWHGIDGPVGSFVVGFMEITVGCCVRATSLERCSHLRATETHVYPKYLENEAGDEKEVETEIEIHVQVEMELEMEMEMEVKINIKSKMKRTRKMKIKIQMKMQMMVKVKLKVKI